MAASVNDSLAALALAAVAVPHYDAPPHTVIGPQIASQDQEDQYHPLLPVVTTALTPLAPGDRANVLSARLGWVQQHITAAERALGAIGVAADLPVTLALSTASASAWPLKVPVRVSKLWYRLRAGYPIAATSGPPAADDTSSDQALAALTNPGIITSAASSPAAAAMLLLQLRCLADVYLRWEIGAMLTAQLTGLQLAQPPLTSASMLARILTYFRIEGDCSVPPGDDTLEGTDPGSYAPPPPALPPQVPLPPGRSGFTPFLNPSAYLRCVTCLAAPDLVPGYGDPYGLPLNLASDAAMTWWADRSFCFTLGGLDILWYQPFQISAETFSTANPGPFPSAPWNLMSWAALNRQIPPTVSADAARAAAAADFAARESLLYSRPKGPAATAAIRTTPVGSGAGVSAGPYSCTAARYTALVLSEGIRYLNRLSYGPVRFGTGAVTVLPEILVYALYHMGSYAQGMLASAAASTLPRNPAKPDAKSSWARSLKSALDTATGNWTGSYAGLPAVLRQIRSVPTPEQSTAIATDNWDLLGPLLGTPPVVQPLADFLRNESDTSVPGGPVTWTGWAGKGEHPLMSPRGNCVGYAALFDYLSAQISASATEAGP